MIEAPPNAGNYRVVLADPPWHHGAWSEKGEGKSASRHYDTMTLDEIADLPVKDWVADNCVLFKWFTFPLLEQVMSPRIVWNDDGSVTIKPRVYESWGFKYSQIGWVWRKYNAETGKFAFGGGKATRKNLEPCIICWRGNNPVFDKSVRDFIDNGDFLDAKRRLHSQKPDEQYDRIERMFDGPYLEMFATQARDGWDHWSPKAHRFDNS